MKRNWYVICTQNKREKQVASLLTKKGFESYCPFTVTERKNASRSTREYGPLFKSYVFVNAFASDFRTIKRISNVINPLYWGAKPAIISPDEINAIKMMVENYGSICTSKISVNTSEKIGIVEESIINHHNNITSIKHQGISVSLPTLGYSLTAERTTTKPPVTEKKESFTSSLARRLNPMLLFGL